MKIQREEIQSRSEIEIFNKIGEYANNKDCSVIYFKTLMPTLTHRNSEDIIKDNNIHNMYLYDAKFEHIHFIHLYREEKLILSIYFDNYNLTNLFNDKGYYELSNFIDNERFTKGNEDKLYERIKELLN